MKTDRLVSMKTAYRSILLFIFPFVLLSCATSDKEFDRQTIEDNTEFEEVVKIVKIDKPESPEVSQEEAPTSQPKVDKKKRPPKVTKVSKKSPQKVTKKDGGKTKKQADKTGSKTKTPQPTSKESKTAKTKQKKQETASKKQKKQRRQPPLEDDEGFDGRRPIVVPYRVGEELTMAISYFAVEAGKFTMQVRPMVQVNGKKSYHFRYIIKSSPLFNLVYRVDDVAETFVDYETLLPSSYEIHVNESKQIRETRTFFDHEKGKATMWDRKQKKNKEVEKEKIQWDLLSYSQNVFSAAYYLRNFTLKVGKELKVHVGHEGKNLVMTAKVLRRETIYTDAGKFDTFVIQPQFDIDGKFKPTGENYLWLTADDRKFIVRLESKIKIGSIVGEVEKLVK